MSFYSQPPEMLIAGAILFSCLVLLVYHLLSEPVITIHRKSQKYDAGSGFLWSEYLDKATLEKICYYVTRRRNYRITWIEENWNVGNLMIIKRGFMTTYITLGRPSKPGGGSGVSGGATNSYFQTIPPAYRRFIEDKSLLKTFRFYSLPTDETIDTEAHQFMYRVMFLAGFDVNWSDLMEDEPDKFGGFQDINRALKDLRRGQNNPTYMHQDVETKRYTLFPKTNGANKYTAMLLVLALLKLKKVKSKSYSLHIHEFTEAGLTELPQWFRVHITQKTNGNTKLIPMNEEIEAFLPTMRSWSLRSARHNRAVDLRLGSELCAFCDETLPAAIEAAHVLDIHELNPLIGSVPFEDVFELANDGDNGFWLCTNHHRPFDRDILAIDSSSGAILYKSSIPPGELSSFRSSITKTTLDSTIASSNFLGYLAQRNRRLTMGDYSNF